MPEKGTAKNPYIIRSVTDFLYMLEWPRAHFRLGNDIDLKDVGFLNMTPVCFRGVLQGDNHRITNLVIRNDTAGAGGLFGKLGRKAKVENLVIENAFIVGEGRVGAITGRNQGEIINCQVKNSVIQGYYNVGGVAGVNCFGAKVDSCRVVNTTLVGYVNIGGVVGNNLIGGEVLGCQSSGKICGSENIGGIVGLNSGHAGAPQSLAEIKGEKAWGQLVGFNRGRISFENGEPVQAYCDQILIFAELVGRNWAAL